MDLIKKFFVLIAIFCVIGSASAVCAADVSDGVAALSESQYQDEGGWAGSQYQDEGGWAGSQYQDEGGWAGSQYNETENNVYSTTNTTNTTANETNETANESAPEVAETTGNATVPHSMFATGNPIFALLGVSALLGGYTILRRKD